MKKLATRTIVFAATAAMVVSGFTPLAMPLTVSAKTSFETDESLKPDAASRVYAHDLTDLGDKQWNFESDDVKVRSYIRWDSSRDELIVHNVDLNITNNNLSTWMAYFTCSRSYTVKLYGTNRVDLNGNVCLFQSTGGGDITIVTDNSSSQTGELYTNMAPAKGSTTKDECHFIESSGKLKFDGVNVSVTTKGTDVNAYTNIWGKGGIDVVGSYVSSQMEATSSNMSCNAIATNGDMNVDANSTLIAKCNVPDAVLPYWTVNNAVLVKGTFKDEGSKLYLTNVNGHVLNAGDVNIKAASPITPEPVYKAGSATEIDYVTLGYTDSTGAAKTGIKNDITAPAADKFLFYSDSAYVTDGSNFLTTTDKKDGNKTIKSLTYATADGNTTFSHANIAGDDIPDTAKTLMTNPTMNLIAKSTDATCGVAYENGDIILAIKGDINDAKLHNELVIDGKVIDMSVWGDAVQLSNEYTAIKIEGGTITSKQDGVYYYILSKDFGQYLGKGTHIVEIRTSNGIITTTIIVPESSDSAGDSVNDSDAYGKIISITKNKDGDTVYTYDTGTIRIAKYDDEGNSTNTIITFPDGNVLVKNPDGTSTLTQPNGSVISYDKDGNITNIYNAPDKDDDKEDNGYTSSIVKNSDGSYAVTVKGDWSKFKSVLLDGTALSETNYTKQTDKDTTVLTISADYVKTLSAGTHSITILFENGSTACTFTTSKDNSEISSDASALNAAISSISDGFTRNPVTDEVLTSAKKAMADATPKNKTSKMIGLTNVDVEVEKQVAMTTDGKYHIQFNMASITASDNIMMLHQLSDKTWETISPSTIGNGYVTADFNSLSPVSIVKLTDSVTVPEASKEAKEWDSKILDITSGFSHNAIMNDADITSAVNFMNTLKGTSKDTYTMSAISNITKADGVADGTVSMGISGFAKGDTAKAMAKQSDGTWKEIAASVNDNGKVEVKSNTMATGTIAVTKVVKANTDNPNKEPSATAKNWDANITDMTNGFSHFAILDDGDILTATNFMNTIKGTSKDSYTMAAITKITKAEGMSDGILTLGVKGISKNDTAKAMAKQSDGTWKEIAAAIDGNGKVGISSSTIGTGTVAIVKVSKTVAEASAAAKAFDAKITAISNGFMHMPTMDDTDISSSVTFMSTLALNGNSYSIGTVTNISKMTGIADGILSLSISGIERGDTVRALAKQSNGIWKEIIATVDDAGRVNMSSNSLESGTIAVFELFKPTKEASAEAKAWDAKITDITAGFGHAAVLNDTDIITANSFMNVMKGTSSDIYSMGAISKLSKVNSFGTDATTISLGISGFSKGDTAKAMSKQSDGTWKEIMSSVDNNGKVNINATTIGDGTVAIVKVTKQGNGGNNNSGNGNTSNNSGNNNSGNGNTSNNAGNNNSNTGNNNSGNSNAGNNNSGNNGNASNNGSGNNNSGSGNTGNNSSNTGNGSNNSSNGSGTQTENKSESKALPAEGATTSAKTGQNPITMFFTYLKNGLGL